VRRGYVFDGCIHYLLGSGPGQPYHFDPSLAPAGKSAVIVMLRTDYDTWQRIYGRRPYDTEQSEVSDQVIDFLERIYSGLRRDIEVVGEAMPLSYERYTGNWQGSSTGWLLTRQTMTMNILGIRKTLPGLRNFVMCGAVGRAGRHGAGLRDVGPQRNSTPLPRGSSAVCERAALSGRAPGNAYSPRFLIPVTSWIRPVTMLS
jgi:hypothetical protein